jgi:outer membrane protein
MRFTTIWQTVSFVVGHLGVGFAVLGQTPVSSISTNALGVPPPDQRPLRPLSLEECIRLALQHNFTLQIQRWNPIRFQYQVAGSYGYYDPVISVDATETEATTSGYYDPAIGELPSATARTRRLNSQLSGTLPSGLRYDIATTTRHQSGDASTVYAGIPLLRPFETYEASTRLTLTQPLLKNFWTDSGRTAIQVAKKDLKISELEFENQVRLVIRDVIRNYYELIYARELVKVREKALELAQALLAQNREKVRVGVLAPLDEKQAEAQAATSLADLLAARRQVAFQENLLKNLITDHYESWYGQGIEPTDSLVAVPQVFDLRESWVEAVTKRPDLRMVRAELEKQGLIVRLNFNQLFPSLDIVGSYGISGVDTLSISRNPVHDPATSRLVGYARLYEPSLGGAWDGILNQNNPRHSIGAVLSFPLSLRAERNRYQQAKATLKQIELQVRQLEQSVRVEVDDAISQAESALQRVSATREARLYAEAALDAEQKKLDAGKSTSFEVLRLQRDLTAARSAEIRALADYNQALVNLYAAEGTLLERRRISIEFK